MKIRSLLGFGEPEDWQKVLWFILVWAAAVVIALSKLKVSNVQTPPLWMPPVWMPPDYALKHGQGYTYSLSLLALPLLVLIWWYRRASGHDASLRVLIRAVIWGSLLTAVVFVLFDSLFASLLFTFPDRNSVLGVHFPGYTWDGDCSTIWHIYRLSSCYERSIPIEEIAFYLGGAAVLRGMYIWSSEDFLERYTMKPAEYAGEARKVKRLLSLNWRLLAVMLAILIIGVYAKRRLGSEGYPVYLFLQVLIVGAPVVLLYTQVKPFINTRALLMVMVLQVLVSVIWEVTAAVPYGWWGYKPAGMIGHFVRPWSDLPIEACLFWIGVAWSAMFVHEATKIKVRSNRSWRSILLGDKVGQDVSALSPG